VFLPRKSYMYKCI